MLKWYLKYVLGIVVVLVPGTYLEGHFFLHLSLMKLVYPELAFGFLFLLTGPFLYWARGFAISEKKDFRRLYLVVTIFATGFCCLVAFYGESLRVIQEGVARVFLFTSLLLVPIGSACSYFIRKKQFS